MFRFDPIPSFVGRFYDPDLGRWLSTDPSGESAGVNLYAYVANNSPNAIDPLGLDAIVLLNSCDAFCLIFRPLDSCSVRIS
jgi:uncharacterized protein RhaS with RHS repeats